MSYPTPEQLAAYRADLLHPHTRHSRPLDLQRI